MKLTKRQLRKIIKEELEVLSEVEQSVSVDLTQEEANLILMALEGLMEQPDPPATISSLYDKILDSGIHSGFGEEPTQSKRARSRARPLHSPIFDW